VRVREECRVECRVIVATCVCLGPVPFRVSSARQFHFVLVKFCQLVGFTSVETEIFGPASEFVLIAFAFVLALDPERVDVFSDRTGDDRNRSKLASYS
jgi:hypothetical protein